MNLRKKNNNELSQGKLDLEFQRILRIIRPYIPYIMNNYHLTLYKMWLEKLSELGAEQKEERNHYLIELCHQIQDGILEEPFTQLPPLGPLPPFKVHLEDKKVGRKQELISARQLRHTIVSGIDSHNKHVISQKDPEHWNSGHNNSEVPALYQERNNHTVQNHSSAQNDTIDENVATLPKQDDAKQLLSKVDVPQEQVARKKVQPHFTNLKQDHYTGVYYLETQCEHSNIGNMFSQQLPQSKQKGLPLQDHTIHENPKLKKSKSQQDSINISIKSVNQNGDSDSSWNDLTDASNSTKINTEGIDDTTSPVLNHLEPGNNSNQNYLYEMYDARITDLMNIITELQKQNLSLNEDVAKYERDLSLKNSNAETSIFNLAGEVKSLKNGLRELTEIKSALRNSHLTASLQWQNSINTLNKELYVSQKKNVTLELEINELKQEIEKIESFQQRKFQDDESLKQTLCDMHAEDIRLLKEQHAKHVESMEKKFLEVLTERDDAFSHQKADLKSLYERKIFDIISGYDKIMKKGSVEMQIYENTITNQTKSVKQEVQEIGSQTEEYLKTNSRSNLKKIEFLKKCLWKIDHLFKRSEKKYNKRILKLKNQIEVRDKALQIQLTAQRAELLATTNTKRQVETDAMVLLLEQRYRKMLENQQAHFLTEKQNDVKLIADLRSKINKKHNR